MLASSDTDLSDQLRNSFAPPLLRCGVLDVSGRRCVFPSRARLCRTYASSLFHTTSGQRRAVYDGEGVLTFVRAGVDRRRMLGPFRCSSEAPFRRLLRRPTGSPTLLAVERTRPTAPERLPRVDLGRPRPRALRPPLPCIRLVPAAHASGRCEQVRSVLFIDGALCLRSSVQAPRAGPIPHVSAPPRCRPEPIPSVPRCPCRSPP